MLMLAAVSINGLFLIGVATVFTLSGYYLTLAIFIRRYIYTGVLLSFHLGMTAFVTYVFVYRDKVEVQPMFAFSTFTEENLKIAIVNLVAACLATFICWRLFLRRDTTLANLSTKELLQELIARFKKIPPFVFVLSLMGSFLSAFSLFFTNSSVLNVSYPFQLIGHWVPSEIMKIPTLVATFTLVYAYIQNIHSDSKFGGWLFLGKINFILVSLLMLLLMGGRGMFVFLWLFIGLYELMLWKRGKSSFSWGLLFLLLAWFAYISWPYMRSTLTELPLGQVLKEAFLIGLGLSNESGLNYQNLNGIRLDDYPVIGQLLFHFLYVIELIKNGVSLGGATFVNLIPQALPSFLDGIFWERPLNDNWLLDNYYHHGGGFFLMANAYWNGGTWVAILYISILSSVFTWLDRIFTKSGTGLLYRFIYLLWLPIMIVQLAYGIQGMTRVIELLIFIMILNRFSWNLGRRN